MQGSGIAALEAVRAAAFSRGQKDDRQVSDPIEVGPNHVVVIQVTDHAPSVLRPLEEVIDQVRADLQADRREKAARAAAEALHARARAGETLEALAAEVGGVVQQSSGVFRQAGLPDAAIVREGFRLLPQEEGKPADVGLAALGDGRYALVVATGRKPGELEGLGPEVRAQIRAQGRGCAATWNARPSSRPCAASSRSPSPKSGSEGRGGGHPAAARKQKKPAPWRGLFPFLPEGLPAPGPQCPSPSSPAMPRML
jgi:hypothetical protein